MNLRKEIRKAYSSVHAPEDTAEKIRQKLYQKESTHDDSESDSLPEIRRTGLGRHAGLIAAAAVTGLVIGISVQSMLSRRTEEVFQPAAKVPAEVTENITESESESESDLNNSEISGNTVSDGEILSEQEIDYHE